MSGRRSLALWVFSASTLAMWLGRVRNIWNDAELDGRRIGALLPVAAFVVVGLAVGWVARGGGEGATARRVTAAAAIFTVGYWAVRMAVIIGRDHPIGFVIVHGVLALASSAAAWWAWTAVAGGGPVRAASGAGSDDDSRSTAERADTVSAGPDPGGV